MAIIWWDRRPACPSFFTYPLSATVPQNGQVALPPLEKPAGSKPRPFSVALSTTSKRTFFSTGEPPGLPVPTGEPPGLPVTILSATYRSFFLQSHVCRTSGTVAPHVGFLQRTVRVHR